MGGVVQWRYVLSMSRHNRERRWKERDMDRHRGRGRGDNQDTEDITLVCDVTNGDIFFRGPISALFPELGGMSVLPDANRILSVQANLDLITPEVGRLIQEYMNARGGIGAWVSDHFGVTMAVLIIGPLVKDGGGPPKFLIAMTENDLDMPNMPTYIRDLYKHYVNRLLPKKKADSN